MTKNIKTYNNEKPKFVIIAWHLRDNPIGHIYPYWMITKNIFEKKGFEVITLASSKFKKKDSDKNIYPCLRRMRENIFYFKFLAPFSYFLFAIISAILTSINIQLKLKKLNPKKDIVFVQNIYYPHDILPLFCSFRKTKFKTFTLIRNPIKKDFTKLPFITHIYAFIIKKLLINLLKNNKNVIPGTDSTMIAKDLEMATRRNDVVVFPMYHNIKETNIPKKKNKKIIISLPGALIHSRFFTKGADIIMNTFKYIIKNNLYPLTDRIIFMFQESPEPYSIYNEFIKDLKKMKIEYIKEKSYLNEKKYNNFIILSDIIVLPYKLEHYKIKTSGVYIDAIMAKKNVITVKDSWMYHISKNKIKSNLFFKNNDHKDLAEKIIELLSNFSYYKAQTNNAKKVFEKIHNEENFFNCFFKKV